jgi:tetrahydromethanopterin S-methyltransferase subunit B
VRQSLKVVPAVSHPEQEPVSDYVAGYNQGLANGIWIGAIGSPTIIAIIFALARYLTE